MRAVARGAVHARATGLLDLPLAAQVGWEPPRPPCELVSGNSKIDKGMQVLRGAVEKPDQREPQLVQAKKALGEAITQDNQSTNPAAWYYLGRYYVIVGDVAGADTALSRAATLAPKCAEDIATYRGELLSKLLNDGLSAWQDGKQDSALGLLQVAARLDPGNPKAFATVAALYASRSNDDSALAYYRLAARTAGDAAAFADDPREDLGHTPDHRGRQGAGAQAAAVFDSLVVHSKDLAPDALSGPGTRMEGQGLYGPAARALTLGLAKTPYRRDALFSLAVAYYQLHDSTALLPTAQRLLALDPLNRASLKLVAAGWDFLRQRDSTKAYVARADAGLAVEITVLSFVPDSEGAALSAAATNLKAAPSNPLHVTFEFLDPARQLIATQT